MRLTELRVEHIERMLRRGEDVGLRWQDIDLVTGVLHVRQQIVEVAGRSTIGKPKTSSGEERRVDLPDQLVGALMAHQLIQREEHESAARWDDTDLVFTQPDGTAYRPEYVTRRMKALAKRAGLPPKRLHDLRHGAASLQLAAWALHPTAAADLDEKMCGQTIREGNRA